MDPDTESLLVSTCLALGGFEDRSENLDDTSRVYVMGDECLGRLQNVFFSLCMRVCTLRP